MINKPGTVICENPEKLSETLAEDFYSLSEIIIKEKNYMNVALSGGSTPKLLYTVFEKKYLKRIDWSRINFYWADERCVPAESSESNYGEAERILFNKISVKKNIYKVRGDDNPEKEAERYSELIKKNLPESEGYPVFDLIMLGAGDDGHTASIFPDKMELLESEKICAAVQNPAGNQFRITLTGRVINNADRIIFLVTGKNKAGIVRDILEKKNNFLKYPAAHIQNKSGNVEWYLDFESAGLLNLNKT